MGEPPYDHFGNWTHQEILARQYVFANKMKDEDWKDILQDYGTIFRFQDGDENQVQFYPHKDTVNTIFGSDQSLEAAPSFLVNMVITYGKPAWVLAGEGEYYVQFLEEVARQVCRARAEGWEGYMTAQEPYYDEPNVYWG